MQFPAIIMLYFCTNLEELYIMGVGRGGNRGITPPGSGGGGGGKSEILPPPRHALGQGKGAYYYLPPDLF